MNNRKSRRKLVKQKKINERKNKIKELEILKNKAIELEAQLKQQKIENIKQFNIRNLKVFKNTCNFLTPFILTTGVTVGAFKVFGGGLPFYLDETVKYKVYNLEFQTNGYITMEEEYRTNRWFDQALPSNKLMTYTKWKFIDNQYIRYKREYEVDNSITLDLYNAVINENYDYIIENIKDYKEEIQVANNIEEIGENNYFFQASFHMFDKEDILKYNETNLTNTIITIIELVLSIGFGGVVNHFRKFNYLNELKRDNNIYHSKIKSVKSIEEELKITNEKILTLSRKKRGKN